MKFTNYLVNEFDINLLYYKSKNKYIEELLKVMRILLVVIVLGILVLVIPFGLFVDLYKTIRINYLIFKKHGFKFNFIRINSNNYLFIFKK